MTLHLIRDLGRLKEEILAVGSMVEQATQNAIKALLERRADLAEDVLRGDHRIDRKEVEVEEECLKVLALHNPVAADLRFIVGVIKVNNDLERMGDLAANISSRAIYLASHEPLPVPLDDLSLMGKQTSTMVRDSLDALVGLEPQLARKVCSDDDLVDASLERIFETFQEVMMEDPSTVARATHTISAARHLERIADLATNIAEDVIFMVEGRVVRHAASPRVDRRPSP